MALAYWLAQASVRMCSEKSDHVINRLRQRLQLRGWLALGRRWQSLIPHWSVSSVWAVVVKDNYTPGRQETAVFVESHAGCSSPPALAVALADYTARNPDIPPALVYHPNLAVDTPADRPDWYFQEETQTSLLLHPGRNRFPGLALVADWH